MKKIFTTIAVLAVTVCVSAQAPQKMSYQAVIRNNSNVLIANQPVGMRISILQGSPTGTEVYKETYSPNPQTNSNGLVTVEIGGGTPVTGTFSNINWSAGPYYLKTETDPAGGTNYTITGTSQLLSVPYSFYTNSAGNGFASSYSVSEKRPVLNLADGNIGIGAPPDPYIKLNVNGIMNVTPGTFSTWGVNLALDATSQAGGVRFGILSLSNGAGEGGGKLLIKNDSESSTFVMDNNGHTGINNLYPSRSLDVKGDINFTGSLLRNGNSFITPQGSIRVKPSETSMDSALFEVKNKNGQTIFAVYNEGVRIYVDDGLAKGATKGGFAIGGFGTAKGTSQPYFVVDPDSIRAYIDNNPVKAVKGGFAIGGFDRSKLIGNQQLLTVSDDSVRIYINDNLTKAVKGGFAIGGFDKSKGGNTNFLNVSTDASGKINPSQNRILWYPIKNAFLTGKVLITDSANVGVNSFATGYESSAKGRYSQAMGFKAISNGDYSTAIGKNALANRMSSFAFGDSAQATGNRSFAFGSWDVDNAHNRYPTEAIGDNSIAIGLGAKSSATAAFSIGSIGFYSVINWPDVIAARNMASGNSSMAIGFGNSATTGSSIAFGIGNTSNAYRGLAIGYNNYSNGDYSLASGCQTVTTKAANHSTTLGYGLIANIQNSTIVGAFNDTLAIDVQFVIGNGYRRTYPLSPIRQNAMVVLKNGNIGIGTSSPVNLLSVHGTRSNTINSSNAIAKIGGADVFIYFGALNGSPSWDTWIQPLRPTDNYPFNLSLCPVGGNIGVGTATPQGKIAIRNGLYGGLLINVNSDGATWKGSWTNIQTGNYAWLGGDTWSDLYLQGKGGDVGIGILGTGGYKLYVNGTAYSTGGWAGSDVRWKKNIIPLTDVLDKLLNLNGVNYEWRKTEFPEINFDGGQQIGLIAQEVEKIFPQLVRTDKNGYKAVSYEKLSVVLVEGLKEQQNLILEQKEKIDNQQKELDELKTLVNTLVANQTGQGNK